MLFCERMISLFVGFTYKKSSINLPSMMCSLIMRSASLARSKVRPVLVKVKKPTQETRADLPTIGTQTIINAYSAGFTGIAIEAGSTFVVDKADVIQKADELGLFVLGIDEKCLKNTD